MRGGRGIAGRETRGGRGEYHSGRGRGEYHSGRGGGKLYEEVAKKSELKLSDIDDLFVTMKKRVI